MPTYAETVKYELERLEDFEIQQRISGNQMTEEAMAIAMSILNARGASLEPSVLPNSQESAKVQSRTKVAKENPSFFLGIGIITTFIGFSIVLNMSSSMEYAFGVTLGRILVASIVALPIFLVWRFFTTSGRNQSLSTAFNAFAVIVGILWLLVFFVFTSIIPAIFPVR